eukprot:3223007-Amphidinium_carterae.1
MDNRGTDTEPCVSAARVGTSYVLDVHSQAEQFGLQHFLSTFIVWQATDKLDYDLWTALEVPEASVRE